MFNRVHLPGLLAGLLLALVASTGTALAESTQHNPSVSPVTVTLQVPTTATATSTTVRLRIRTDVQNQQTDIQVTSDAAPSAPTIIAASVGGNSVATVPVDASSTFDWAVSPNPTRAGCGPHPAAGTPGCADNDAVAQPDTVGVDPASLDGTTVDVAGAQTIAAASPASSAAALQYTVQRGDTLTAVARRFYGSNADALAHVVAANLGQQMPDGRVLADSNQIEPGWVLSLPLPSQAAYDQDGRHWYIVQPGDSLSSIAARLLGSPARWPELYGLNRERIETPSRIAVGARLQLPTSAAAEPGHADGDSDAGPLQQGTTAPSQEARPAAPEESPGPSLTPTWAAPLRSTPSSPLDDRQTNSPGPRAAGTHLPSAAASASFATFVLGAWLSHKPATHAALTSHTERRAERRAHVLQALLDGSLSSEDAATQLELSRRQLSRLLAAYRRGGVDALRHANSGRVPAHAVPDGVREQILELARTRYAGLSQSELAHRLATEHGINLHRTTVRRIVVAGDQDAIQP